MQKSFYTLTVRTPKGEKVTKFEDYFLFKDVLFDLKYSNDQIDIIAREYIFDEDTQFYKETDELGGGYFEDLFIKRNGEKINLRTDVKPFREKKHLPFLFLPSRIQNVSVECEDQTFCFYSKEESKEQLFKCFAVFN